MDFLGRTRTLVRIVETGSLSAAGRSLGLSLPAVSRQLGTLEDEVGARLVVRTTRRLQLTEEGRRFHAHATRLVQEADAALASVRPDGKVAGNVTLSASVSLGVLRLVPALPRMMAAHPALTLDLRLEDRAADLVGEGVDVAVRAGMMLPDTTTLVAVPLAAFPRLLVASPAYLRREGTPRTVAALAGHEVLGTTAARFVVEGESETVATSARLRVETLLARRAAVLAGVGIAALPDFVVGDDVAAGTLRVLLPHAELEPAKAFALYRVEARGTARIEAVLAWLRSAVPLRRAR